MASRNELSNSLKQHQLFIGALSQMMRNVISKRCERFMFFFISHDDVSEKINGILKFECVVRPPGNNIDVIPDDVIARTIRPLDRIVVIIVCHKKVFCVPPCPWTNIKACFFYP